MLESDRYFGMAYDFNDNEASRKRFGSAVRSFRESQGISLKALSKNIGFSPSYLSRVENGITPPSGKFVEKLADELGVSRFNLAFQGGLLRVNWDRMTRSQLEDLKRIVDTGTFRLQK